MAVVIETTLGDITVDLFVEQRPQTCLNFLKLCRIKYYNYNLFHMVRSGFIAQTGDPSGEGTGGQSIWGMIYGQDKSFFTGEKMPKIRHTHAGLLSMVCIGDTMVGSQFFFTLAPNLDSLDGRHCVIGAVTEGYDVLRKFNDIICDEACRPYQDVRITHTVILDDPYLDPPGLIIPSRSPSPTADRLACGRIAPDEDLDETKGKSTEEIVEMIEDKEAKARATILEIVGDLPDADVAPPENVLFVCKLNPVTTDDDLEIIFSRFGKIVSCEVIRDRKTGDSLQYAFIEFADKKSCENAYFKMDNVLIDDRRIHVDFSQSVSKIKWLGKGRGVKHITDNGPKNDSEARQRRSNSKDHQSHERESNQESEREHNRDYKDSRNRNDLQDQRRNHKERYSQNQEMNRSRDHNQDRSRDNNQDCSQDHNQDRSRGHDQDRGRDHNQNRHRDHTKELSRVHSQDHNQDHSRDNDQERHLDHSKGRSQDHSQDRSRDHNQDRSRGHNLVRNHDHNQYRSRDHDQDHSRDHAQDHSRNHKDRHKNKESKGIQGHKKRNRSQSKTKHSSPRKKSERDRKEDHSPNEKSHKSRGHEHNRKPYRNEHRAREESESKRHHKIVEVKSPPIIQKEKYNKDRKIDNNVNGKKTDDKHLSNSEKTSKKEKTRGKENSHVEKSRPDRNRKDRSPGTPALKEEEFKASKKKDSKKKAKKVAKDLSKTVKKKRKLSSSSSVSETSSSTSNESSSSSELDRKKKKRKRRRKPSTSSSSSTTTTSSSSDSSSSSSESSSDDSSTKKRKRKKIQTKKTQKKVKKK